MLHTKALLTGTGAIVVAGVGVAVLVGPAFGQPAATTSSSTTTTASATTASAPSSGGSSCKKPYPPTARSLPLFASPTSVVAGNSVTFSGSLTSNSCPLTKEPLTLNLVQNNNTATVVASTTTDNKGNYSVTYTPSASGTFFASFAGDADYLATQSNSVNVKVTKK